MIHCLCKRKVIFLEACDDYVIRNNKKSYKFPNTDVASAPIETCKKVFNEPIDEALKQFDSLPCVSNPSLARILFHTTNLFDKIPVEIYTPVEDIFAKIHCKAKG